MRDITDGPSNTLRRDNRTIKRGFQTGTVSSRDISDTSGTAHTLRRDNRGAKRNRRKRR